MKVYKVINPSNHNFGYFADIEDAKRMADAINDTVVARAFPNSSKIIGVETQDIQNPIELLQTINALTFAQSIESKKFFNGINAELLRLAEMIAELNEIANDPGELNSGADYNG